MDQRIIDLFFDGYSHKPLCRDVFIDKLTGLAGSITAGLAFLPPPEVNYPKAKTILPKDERLIPERISYKADRKSPKGYLAQSKQNKKTGSVMVIHENRGLNAHEEDVERRVALTPDASFPWEETGAEGFCRGGAIINRLMVARFFELNNV